MCLSGEPIAVGHRVADWASVPPLGGPLAVFPLRATASAGTGTAIAVPAVIDAHGCSWPARARARWSAHGDAGDVRFAAGRGYRQLPPPSRLDGSLQGVQKRSWAGPSASMSANS